MPKFVVRYGSMRALGVMASKDSESFRRGNEVIVRSNRGIETGLVLCEATDDALSHLDQPTAGHILRGMSDDDARELAHIEDSRKEKTSTCQRHIDELELEMQLVEIEQLLGGERIVIYYLAEDRVDFRELVKRLAADFQTRIEMKQIGVRDEAKILADYGDCGRPVCCNTHLSKMPPVSMKMAKVQKATLDPTKISGRCGRLKCCLRYEFDTYEAIQKELPRIGAHIATRDGRAKVIGQEVLAEQLLIETEDHRRMVIDASEVLSVIKREPKKKPDREKRDSGKGSESESRSSDAESSENSESKSGDSSHMSGDSKGKKRRPRRSRKPRKNDGNQSTNDEKPDNKN